MRAVGYSKKMSFILRYSNVPLKEQNDRIRTYVASKGWTMSGFYNDKSDDNDSDSGFKKLETDGINRQFDVVVIDSIYRCGVNVSFARELLLNVFYLAGIHFAIVEDDIYIVYSPPLSGFLVSLSILDTVTAAFCLLFSIVVLSYCTSTV